MITDCGVLPVKNTKSKRCNMLPPSIKMHPHFSGTSYRYLSMGEMICQSYVMTDVINCLASQENVRLQGLNRFFYKTQPRCFSRSYPVAIQKRRLHLLNQDYVIIFDFTDMSKHKFIIRNAQPLWNHQSIEVRGRIFSTGGAIANTKTYLKSNLVLDEELMSYQKLADMKYERDAHGICSWQDRYIICVGSWHGTG